MILGDLNYDDSWGTWIAKDQSEAEALFLQAEHAANNGEYDAENRINCHPK